MIGKIAIGFCWLVLAFIVWAVFLNPDNNTRNMQHCIERGGQVIDHRSVVNDSCLLPPGVMP